MGNSLERPSSSSIRERRASSERSIRGQVKLGVAGTSDHSSCVPCSMPEGVKL